MNGEAERRELIASVESHERELELALRDLRRALQRPFAVGERIGAELSDHPLPWLAAGLLAGIWLGRR
ncbi:MAG: hypothetical protein SF182_01910 [Deltaproteobacteria bacterium]|nr:hypothetical protein [Deltaproteobacteria bacterium]